MENIKKKTPFFSIVTVVKNDEQNIEKTIKSIFNQSYKNFEYIIVDGKSKDKSLKIINRYKKKIKKIISAKDSGIYHAMNKGAKLAVGKVIVFVNSNDTIKRNALKIIKRKFDLNDKISFVFGTVLRHYTKDSIIKYGFNKDRLKYSFDFATSHSTGFFLKREILKKINYFDTRYKCSADYDVYLKVLLKLSLMGLSTKKNEIIGVVNSGGFSSKVSFIQHLYEETLIRYNNNQNIFLIFIIFFNAIIKHFYKKLDLK